MMYLFPLLSFSKPLDISPVVRDFMMSETFTILRVHFSAFSSEQWSGWFERKLVPLLPSLTAEMLTFVTSNVNCDVYQVM